MINQIVEVIKTECQKTCDEKTLIKKILANVPNSSENVVRGIIKKMIEDELLFQAEGMLSLND